MILRGLGLLARGRAAGLSEFDNTPDGLLGSLAPLIAFPLVGAGWNAVQGQPEVAVVGFLARLCGVLVLPVIVSRFARALGREPFWLRTAAALSWSFWLILPLLLVAAMLGALLVHFGLDVNAAGYAGLAAIAAYLLWLHWFIARHGLRIGGWAAAALVVVNSAAVGGLTDGQALLDWVWYIL